MLEVQHFVYQVSKKERCHFNYWKTIKFCYFIHFAVKYVEFRSSFSNESY